MMQSLTFRIFALLLLPLLAQQRLEDTNVQIFYKWKHPEWLYSNEEEKLTAERQGLFVRRNGAILDSDFYFTRSTSLKRTFVSTPPFRPGIPATLSEVTRLHRNGGFLLKPFPDWSSHNRSTCDGLVSVYRFHIDKCGLLWALDTGRVNTFTNASRVCRPKLVIYDLDDKDAVVLRYEFPDNAITDHSNLATIITESYRRDCLDSIAYIADTNAYGLIVFDLAQKNSWRVNSPHFFPFPNHAVVTANNVTFEMMDGLLALTLSSQYDAERKLYFHSLASKSEGWVPVSVLKKASLATNATQLRKYMTVSEDARTSQSTLEVMTEDGILLYALVSRNAIACWNSKTEFRPENQYIIYEDDENLQFVSGMKLKGNHLLLTSSRLQNYIIGDLSRDDTKYRIILIDDVNQLLVNTPCTRTAPVNSTFRPSTSDNTDASSPNLVTQDLTRIQIDKRVKPYQNATSLNKHKNQTSTSEQLGGITQPSAQKSTIDDCDC